MKNYHCFKWESCPTWVGIVPDNELDPTSPKMSSESPSIWVGISPLKEFSVAILHSKKNQKKKKNFFQKEIRKPKR